MTEAVRRRSENQGEIRLRPHRGLARHGVHTPAAAAHAVKEGEYYYEKEGSHRRRRRESTR
jgi:hypothetical protein